jgi:hypothetical protein
VALWSIMYDIPLDFGQTIVPHRKLNPGKACPGSRFPTGDFERRVNLFAGNWRMSGPAQSGIAAFKLKPYLFAAGRAP